MFNVHKSLTAFLFASSLVLAACSGNSARIEAASAMLTDAQRLVESNHYDSALVVLDTLDHKYRDCLEQRRQGTLLRVEALGAITRDSLASMRLQHAAAQDAIERLEPLFRQVTLPGTDGYWVDKNVYSGSEMNKNSIQLRVDDKGYMFMAVNVGRRIGLDGVQYGDVHVKGRSIDVESSEIMSLHQEAVKPLVDALKSAAESGAKSAVITLTGSKSSVKVTLDSKQLASITATDEYALALQQRTQSSIILEKLERRLAKLNDQMASLIPDPVDE